ncbi:MAG: lipopolysaccharide biosynthesis protein [Pseudomonadales bacterium]
MTENTSAKDTGDLTGRARLVSNVVTSWIAQLLMIITGFFLPRVIDTQLGQVSLGLWDFAWSIVSYVNLAQLGIGSALNRYVAKYRSEDDEAALDRAISTTMAMQWLIAIFVTGAVFVVAYLIPTLFGERLEGESETAQGVFLFLGLSVTVLLVADTSRGVLTGCHRWDLFNAINSAMQILGTVSMIVVMLCGGDLVQVSLAYLLVIIMQASARAVAARRVCGNFRFKRSALSIEFAKEIFGYGIRSIAINIPGLIMMQGAYIAVVSALGPAALAILARPFALLHYIESFITRFTFVLTPMAESVLNLEGEAELKKFAIASSTYGFAFAIPAITVLGVFGNLIVELWMGPDYVNQTVIWIIAGMGLLTSFHGSILRIMIGLDLHGVAARNSLLFTFSFLITGLAIGNYLNWFSLEFFAALIATNAILVNGLYIPIYACRKLGLSPGEFLGAIFSAPIVQTLLLSIGLLAITLSYQPSAFEALVFVCIYGAVVLLVYFVNLLPPSIRQEAMQRIGLSSQTSGD